MIFGLGIAIIAVLIVLIILSIFFKVAKIITRILFVLSTFVIIALVVFGFLVVADFKNFSKNSADSVYYLKSNGSIVAGFIPPDEQGSFYLMGEEELKNASALLANKNYSALKGAHYKAFIFELSFLDKQNISFSLGNANFTGEFAQGMFSSESPLSYLEGSVSKKDFADIKSGINDEAEIKSAFFMAYLASAMKNNQIIMIQGVNSGEITAYPKTPMFFAISALPLSVAKSIVSETFKEANVTYTKVK